MERAREHGDLSFLALALAGIAGVAAANGQPDRAARLFGAAAALRHRIGAVVETWQRPRQDRGMALARAALAPEVVAAAWLSGEALPLDAAIGEALAVSLPDGAPAGSPVSADPAAAVGLTTREGEVLRLLAQGLSNREIADALFISPRTVNFHVTNLLAKLALDSRTAAVAFAIRQGLA